MLLLPLAVKGFLPIFFPFFRVTQDVVFIVMGMQELGYFLR